eukprot:585880-Rhodomonas_salina.1
MPTASVLLCARQVMRGADTDIAPPPAPGGGSVPSSLQDCPRCDAMQCDAMECDAMRNQKGASRRRCALRD